MYIKSQDPVSHVLFPGQWLKRFGLWGFTFFFLKGLLWLLIPWLAHSAFF